ncbi:dihydrofolate reductase [Thalassiella azotivora]
MSVTLVVAVARGGVIGRDGGIPWHLPDDLAHFKAVTLGGTLVMGRRTYESIGRPLPGRRTVVVTRSADWAADGVDVAPSVERAVADAVAAGQDVYVAGGAQVYADALALADRAVVSEVDAEPDGDTFWPGLDPAVWREVSRVPREGFEVVTYERVPAGDR